MVQRLNEKLKAAGADQGSERASTKSAKSQNILTTRIEAGDELKHEKMKGIVGHVDGHGQCLTDSIGRSSFIQNTKLAESEGTFCALWKRPGVEPRTLRTGAERAANCAARPGAQQTP